MTIDPTDISAPMAPESNIGGSYMPQQQMPAVPKIDPADGNFAKMLAESSRGQASDIDDFGLTMAGIAYGDPVGLETFDLGFFEDGTPAIAINGVNIPIDHGQWMSMMQMRNQTRAETKRRMEFEVQRQRAKKSISSIVASVPNLPNGMAPLMLGLADIDPIAAMNQAAQLLPSIHRDGGRSQMGTIAGQIKKTQVDSIVSSFNREIEVPVLGPDGKPSVLGESRKTNNRTLAYEKLSGAQGTRVNAYALSRLESLMPNPAMTQMFGGQPIGFMDMVAGSGGDMSELSEFEMVRRLAADSGGMFPSTVPWYEYPDIDPKNPDPQRMRDLYNYLRNIDLWASNTLAWDMSSDQSIKALVEHIVGISANRRARQQAEQERRKNAQDSDTSATSAPISVTNTAASAGSSI